MVGYKSGVAKEIHEEEPRAIYTHCYGNELNLACHDSINKCQLIKNAFDTAQEITKLVKKSHQCDAVLLNR